MPISRLATIISMKTNKKNIGLQSNIEEQNLIYFYLSKESWEKNYIKTI